ncbi:MAG: photosynthetic complex assembly protein PuhC [Roseiarcus sp.]|jgi:putative photosynthetic complex assembly protein
MSQLMTHGRAARGSHLPRGVIAGAASLVVFALIATGLGRVSDIGAVHMPKADVVESLALRFEDREDGAVAVRDSSDDRIIYTVAPGAGGFIRATVRGLVQERKRSGIGPETPFTLTHWSDGTVSLEDLTIGRRVSLEAFGPTNAEAFAQLFAARGQIR